ncbi:NAD-dependent malic enzyme [Pyxidicoccus parkwayensis]|uniref:NAD-dependent malic enzyme n=1 Tax=Pyxidicoccus parkwayensis TaxID=2813578 RepID=A0ABX7NU45_9BACT|nr:NAD-dependent malic enzyme [Pyxidicoccus parkwaysis]QSQ20899.1 NAD-dependent malic enzyme [Pyxidicoccus parkwaysis]
MKQYEKKYDADGRPYLETSLPGLLLTRLPLLNKVTSFTREEREEFGLMGLLPTHVSSLEEQVTRAYANFKSFKTDLEKHVYLRALQDRSEVLFYALLDAHIQEMMPIIYTPTVAQAVEQFSRIYRFPRGLVVNPENIDRIDALLEDTPFPDVQLIVATDNEGILGIGDQGFGGLAICIGKLSLYTAAAGIDPAVTLPVELDVGTNRQDLLDDPLYLGVRMKRLEGQAYDDFIHRFVTALQRRFPRVLLQWEDFSKQKAFDVLERYRDVVPSLNDDIQGTGAVVLAGLLAASKRSQQPLTQQTFVIHGAGAGGVGVARQIVRGLQLQGMSVEAARERIYLIDSKGLILKDRKGLEPYKRELAQEPSRVAGWKLQGAIPSLLETVREAKVTVLLGLSGQRGAFGEEVVREVAKNTPYPVVFALSNPTANSEAIPADVYRWTEGRALVATGSPFDDVEYEGALYPVGQGNNAFIFPGLGLGVLTCRAKRVTDGMLTAAALTLSEFVDTNRLAQGGLYPRMDRIHTASKQVAIAVIRQAVKEGVCGEQLPEDLEAHLEQRLWKPVFLPIRKAR